MKEKICPKCGIPMIEEETAYNKAWWCVICGHTEVKPKNEKTVIL